MQVESEEEKVRKIVMIQYLNDFTFFGIVDPKIAVGGSSIAHEKRKSSYFREKTSSYHRHTSFKSNMALE